jgi:uncharacterized membrane protein
MLVALSGRYIVVTGQGSNRMRRIAPLVRLVALVLLGFFFIVAGTNHFVHPGVYVRIVPPWLSAPALLVQISGVCEILGGVGVLIPKTQRLTGVGLIALLVAVFPANVQMGQHPELYRDIAAAPVFYARLPLQLVLIAWVWWTCISPTSSRNGVS